MLMDNNRNLEIKKGVMIIFWQFNKKVLVGTFVRIGL